MTSGNSFPSHPYAHRKAVRQLMRKYEALQPGGGGPATLLRYAHEVMTQHEAWVTALMGAEDRLAA